MGSDPHAHGTGRRPGPRGGPGRGRRRLAHEAAAYGVEIRLNDGSVVDVALDANFHVIGDVSNDEGAAGEEGAADQNGGDED